MWKDFFYFTKSERRAVLVLLAVLAVLSGGNLWLRQRQAHEAVPLQDSEGSRIDSFIASIHERERLPRRTRRVASASVPVVLQTFDPNTVDSATLRSLGLSAFIAGNVLKYRAKGGVFRTPESFSRLYGLTSEQYETLRPYIRIGESYRIREERDTSAHRQTAFRRDTVTPYIIIEKYPEGTVIDLNKADTAMLKRVPGIGSGLARMIVAYRRRLGGFYAVEQLQEIPYVDASVNSWFRIDTLSLRKLEVNRAGLDRLRAHPYMNFYKAKAIVEYRRKRGKLKGIAQLALFEAFSEADLKRLAPYLSFE